jgi:hypothetical protein
MIALIDVLVSGGLSFIIFARYVLERYTEGLEFGILFNLHIWIILWVVIFLVFAAITAGGALFLWHRIEGKSL